VSAPTFAATELGRKPGASPGIGVAVPLGSKRCVAATEGRLASEPTAVALGYKRGIASGTNHIGEEIPQGA
jgi:hypothetical protein